MTGAGFSGGVVICAIGARTPVGLTADSSAAAWRAGISRIAEHPRYVDKAGEPVRVATDGALDPDLGVADRMQQMASAALHEACEALAGAGRPKATLLVALPQTRPGFSDADAAPLLAALSQASRHSVELSRAIPFARGHAAGLVALHNAALEIEAGSNEVFLVGGVDSWVDPQALSWLDEGRRLASMDNRLGFAPGEAAAFVLVTSVGTARTLKLPILARVRGVALAAETQHRDSEDVCTGEGLTAAVAEATSGLTLPDEKITTTYCDINGERYRSEEFMYVPLRLWAPFVDANRYDTTADAWGDVGAATGPLLLSVAVSSSRRQWARGSSVLVFTGSDAGTRAAATLSLSNEPSTPTGNA